MPYRSMSQMRKLNAMAGEGKIKKSTVDEMNKASEGMKLPEKAPTKPKTKKPTSTDDLRAIRKKKYGF